MSDHPSAQGVGRRAFLLGTVATASAAALDRTPQGGKLRLKVPWPLEQLDPHAIDDPTASLFGHAVLDPLYALDEAGRPYPALAAGMPEPTSRGARVKLRPDLRSGRGRPLDARDLLYSWQRSRLSGGIGLLSHYGEPYHDRADGLAIQVPNADPTELATALASSITALVPRGFSAQHPDGTGAFTATFIKGGLLLKRNLAAARGAAYLDSVSVMQAADLADGLRSFEAGSVDVGWLGQGLHRPRPDAIPFEATRYGWVVLRTGKAAGAWGAPGVAQQLLDTLTHQSFGHLGVYEMRAQARRGSAWGGDPTDLLVDGGASQLLEIGRALAALLTNPGHEIRVVPTPRAELERRRAQRDFGLLLDFVRSPGPTEGNALLALLTAEQPSLAVRPPRLTSTPLREVARTMRLGVLGELRLRGAHARQYRGFERWDLGAVYRLPG